MARFPWKNWIWNSGAFWKKRENCFEMKDIK
jgi:hypothetical protein